MSDVRFGSARQLQWPNASWSLDQVGTNPVSGCLGSERYRAEKRADRVPSGEPRRPRTHGDQIVVSKQGDERIDVGLLPHRDESLDHFPELGVLERSQRRLLTLFGQPRVDRFVRPLQSAIDRDRGGLDRFSWLMAENPSTSGG